MLVLLEFVPLFLLVFGLGLLAGYPFYSWKYKPRAPPPGVSRFDITKEGEPPRVVDLKPGDSIVVQSNGKPGVTIHSTHQSWFKVSIAKSLSVDIEDQRRVVEI